MADVQRIFLLGGQIVEEAVGLFEHTCRCGGQGVVGDLEEAGCKAGFADLLGYLEARPERAVERWA